MRFITLKEEQFIFASSKLFRLFFISNFIVFVDWGRKNISCSSAQGTLATPLVGV